MGEKNFNVSFHDIAWAAVGFYYRSVADRKYCRILGDRQFIEKLRQTPFEITPSEFEQKALLDHINISSYDLLVGHKLAENLLEKIIGLQPDLSALQNYSLLDCPLSDRDTTDRIKKIYTSLSSVPGVWITDVSKIAHLLNDRLLVMLNLDISNHFGLLEGNTGLVDWFKIMQNHAMQITTNFRDLGYSGAPEEFISERLGYTEHGCHKSLVKYLDEYYWLHFADNLSIPPTWIPP
jgi:hypothetical protein